MVGYGGEAIVLALATPPRPGLALRRGRPWSGRRTRSLTAEPPPLKRVDAGSSPAGCIENELFETETCCHACRKKKTVQGLVSHR